MDSWKQYAFSLISCGLCCGILSQIVSNTKARELMRLICGIVLAISILYPLTGVDLEMYLQIPEQNWHAADTYIAEGEKTVKDAQAQCIKASCEAYILDKAKTLGADIMASVTLNEELLPVFAQIRGEADTSIQMELEKILMTDLGIPKENQQWIWNQESSTS